MVLIIGESRKRDNVNEILLDIYILFKNFLNIKIIMILIFIIVFNIYYYNYDIYKLNLQKHKNYNLISASKF